MSRYRKGKDDKKQKSLFGDTVILNEDPNTKGSEIKALDDKLKAEGKKKSKKESKMDNAKKKAFGGKCADNHPPLPIEVGGKVYEVFGGSCTQPAEIYYEADVVIGLDWGMKPVGGKEFPWNEGTVFKFEIVDMRAPSDLEDFKSLMLFMEQSILAGKKVFVGCIGGHGRTGTVLAALVTHMTGMEDSITYVRDKYCQKAVESSAQIDWLHKHYGIKKVEGSKSYGGAGGAAWGTHSASGFSAKKSWTDSGHTKSRQSHSRKISPAYGAQSIHGSNTVKDFV